MSVSPSSSGGECSRPVAMGGELHRRTREYSLLLSSPRSMKLEGSSTDYRLTNMPSIHAIGGIIGLADLCM